MPLVIVSSDFIICTAKVCVMISFYRKKIFIYHLESNHIRVGIHSGLLIDKRRCKSKISISRESPTTLNFTTITATEPIAGPIEQGDQADDTDGPTGVIQESAKVQMQVATNV